MAEKLLPADALEKNAPRTIPPLAGFWFRLAALALDIFLLRLAVQATFPALRPFYQSLGSASLAAGLLLAYLYLMLAEGPVGKGMTLGKAILGIRTTNLRGEPLSIQAAAMRAALLLILALPILGGDIAAQCAARGDRNGVFLASAVVKGLASAFLMANVFLVVLHPLKQTAHDLLAGTLVVREAGAHNLSAFLQQATGQIAPLQRRAIQIASVAFVALAAINAFGEYRQIFSSEGDRYFRFVQSFGQEFRYGPFQPHYQGTFYGSFKSRVAHDGLTTGSWTVHWPAGAKPGDGPTSRSHTVVFEFRSRSAIRPDDIGTSQELAAVGMRAVVWTQQQIQNDIYPLDRETRQRASDNIFQPRYLALLFSREVNALLFGSDRVVYAKILPLLVPEGFYEQESASASVAAPKTKDEQTTRTTLRTIPTKTGEGEAPHERH